MQPAPQPQRCRALMQASRLCCFDKWCTAPGPSCLGPLHCSMGSAEAAVATATAGYLPSKQQRGVLTHPTSTTSDNLNETCGISPGHPTPNPVCARARSPDTRKVAARRRSSSATCLQSRGIQRCCNTACEDTSASMPTIPAKKTCLDPKSCKRNRAPTNMATNLHHD